MGARPAILPRSVWPLLLLLAIAAIWLWREDGAEAPRRLFAYEPERIRELDVRGPLGRTRLVRGPGGWRLDGDRPDRVDAEELAELLDVLTTTLRGVALDDADLRRHPEVYGLDGAGRYELRLLADDGAARLVVGASNPASGLFYARFEGEDSLFLVGEDLVEALHPLPDQVRARDLWPGFRGQDADTLRLRFAGRPNWDLLARDPGRRWWLRTPIDGDARLGEVAVAYNARYDDRRRAADGATWLRALDRSVETLCVYLEEARVSAFLAPQLRPPADGFGVRLGGGREVLYGEQLSESRAQGWRDGYVHGLVLPSTVLRQCADGLDAYLNTDLLDRALSEADSLAISRPDLGRLRLVNAGDGWRVSEPAAPDDPHRLELMAGDLVHFLDHAEIRAVLAPDDSPPLRSPVTLLEIWATGPGVPPRTEIRCARHAETGAPVAWYPGDGRVLEIPRELLNGCRTVLSVSD